MELTQEEEKEFILDEFIDAFSKWYDSRGDEDEDFFSAIMLKKWEKYLNTEITITLD